MCPELENTRWMALFFWETLSLSESADSTCPSVEALAVSVQNNANTLRLMVLYRPPKAAIELISSAAFETVDRSLLLS